MKISVVCQEWEESEAGFGTRPDGWSVHKNMADRDAFVKDFWTRQRKLLGEATPHEYTRECGEPYLMDLDESGELYQKLLKSENGVYGEGNTAPKGRTWRKIQS